VSLVVDDPSLPLRGFDELSGRGLEIHGIAELAEMSGATSSAFDRCASTVGTSEVPAIRAVSSVESRERIRPVEVADLTGVTDHPFRSSQTCSMHAAADVVAGVGGGQ